MTVFLCYRRLTGATKVLKEASLSHVVPAWAGFRHRSMYHAFSHIDTMHVDDSGVGQDVSNILVACLTDTEIKLVNKRLTFMARYCSCPLVKDIGLFNKGFVSSDDKAKLAHYLLYVVYDLLERDLDLQKLVHKTLVTFQEFRHASTAWYTLFEGLLHRVTKCHTVRTCNVSFRLSACRQGPTGHVQPYCSQHIGSEGPR